MLLGPGGVGGQVADIEAYSYFDVDGLLIVTFADQGFTPWIIERATVAANDWCTVSPLETDAGSPTSYVHNVSAEERRTLLFYDADPSVIDATEALRNPNPCGIIRWASPSVVYNNPTTVAFGLGIYSGPPPETPLSQIKIPVLFVYGAEDKQVITRQGQEAQQANFSGSKDKTTVFIPDAGHFPMFERSAPRFRHAIAEWLTAHGG